MPKDPGPGLHGTDPADWLRRLLAHDWFPTAVILIAVIGGWLWTWTAQA